MAFCVMSSPAIWILYARRSCEMPARSLAARTRSPEILHRPSGLYIFKYAPPPFLSLMPKMGSAS
nr:MAG TPA: hypothetical protein [Caudoviricetes sp.]